MVRRAIDDIDGQVQQLLVTLMRTGPGLWPTAARSGSVDVTTPGQSLRHRVVLTACLTPWCHSGSMSKGS